MRKNIRTALLLSLALAAPTAMADPSAADRATARTLAQEGQQALDTKKFNVAAEKFSRADALVHAPTLMLGLARAQLGMGKLVEAQESYNRIIREGVPQGSPRSWTKALEDATKEVDTITGRLPWVTITVLGPTNPEVVVDSTPVPVASLGVKRPINPGTHTIKVGAEGFLPAEKTITLAEGQAATVSLELEQAPVESHAAGPITAPDRPTSAPANNTRKTVAFVAFGVGGAGLLVGGITGALAMSKHARLIDDCNGRVCDRETYGSNVNSFHTVAAISTAGFIVAGVGAAAGAVLLFLQPSEPSQTAKTATVSPYLGVGSAGVRGSF